MNKFDCARQKADDQLLGELIVKLVGKPDAFQWIQHVQRFICALLKNTKASYLVAKTTVFLYVEAVMKQQDGRLSAEARDQMRQTSEYLSTAIADNDLKNDILAIICDTFFAKISSRPEIVQNAEGCTRIIVKFLSYAYDIDLNIKAIKQMIRCGEIRVSGRRILRFFSNADIVQELTTIITVVKSIKLQAQALDLARHIEL